jgi:transketolase
LQSSGASVPQWSALDDRAIIYARALAADAVQRAGNGHPGTAMALAPAAYLLFQRHMRHDPQDPSWVGRDRFILSCGHSSLTLYTQLLYSGYGLTLDDLKNFRKMGSKTPGHPEYGHTAGVETTTGPLGQGIANGVGMAMAARFERGLLDPDAPINKSIFDHYIYVLASDGDLQEGVSAEASSLAGVQKLHNLVVIYDDNDITIEGDISLAFREDVDARYRAYGWNVLNVGTAPDGSLDIGALHIALESARSQNDMPTLIRVKSVIAWPAPKLQGTSKSHGSALGKDEVAATKIALGLNPEEDFQLPDDVLTHVRKVSDRGGQLRRDWDIQFKAWQLAHPDRASILARMESRVIDGAILGKITADFSSEKEISTRKASGDTIAKIGELLPEFWGGSADLAESNNTTIEGGGDFLPENPYGRIIHFGIREHAMGSLMNGIALHGGTRIFGGTFLVFSDYMRPTARLAALMNLPVTFIWSHDSIGLGEDGPTHQPIEHIASLRVIPGLSVIRPADANEVAIAWRELLSRNKPAALLLSRQNLPVFDRSQVLSADGVAKGAYILHEPTKAPVGIIIATGSEVALALAAARLAENEGLALRVVSAPCLEWFNEQTVSYRESVLPPSITARVSVEAGVGMGWREYVGAAGEILSLEHFGASASGPELFSAFGYTPENILARMKSSLAAVQSNASRSN